MQIAMGLRIYFDKALPQQLLYASELEQAEEVLPQPCAMAAQSFAPVSAMHAKSSGWRFYHCVRCQPTCMASGRQHMWATRSAWQRHARAARLRSAATSRPTQLLRVL